MPDTADHESKSQSGWSKRTQAMKEKLQSEFEETETVSFKAMTTGGSRKNAATSLFELLVLKTKGFIDVEQPKAFGDIIVSATPLMA